MGDISVNNNTDLTWAGGSLSGVKIRYIATEQLKDKYTEEEVLNSLKGYRIKSLLRGRNSKIEHVYANLGELEPERKEADIKRNFNTMRAQIIGAKTLESLDSVPWDMP
jgi:hypothetical protein